jgi:hypothetical protein
MFLTFSSNDLQEFLVTMDKHMSTKQKLLIIGGTAASLGFKVSKRTRDIDFIGDFSVFEEAYKKAKQETGLDIPFEPVNWADGPYDFEDRLQEVKRLKLKKIKLFHPDPYDLVLMKASRGEQHDLEANKEICSNENLSAETLIERYNKEMGHTIGNKSSLQLNMFALIETVFGEDVFNELKATIKKHKQ